MTTVPALSAEDLHAELDASPSLTRCRVPASFPTGPGWSLVSGSINAPERPRVWSNGDVFVVVAGTDDPRRVPFHRAWRTTT